MRVLDRNWVQRAYGFAFATLVVVAFSTLPLGGSTVQAHEWDMQGTIGVAVPAGDLSDVSDPGFGLGFGLTRWVNKWVGFHLGLAANMLSGKDPGPDLTLVHYNAGIEGDLINPSTSKLRLHANAGIGATTTSAKDVDSSTDFTINIGPNLEYQFNDKWNGLVGTQLYVILADETEVVLPVYVGFRYAFSE